MSTWMVLMLWRVENMTCDNVSHYTVLGNTRSLLQFSEINFMLLLQLSMYSWKAHHLMKYFPCIAEVPAFSNATFEYFIIWAALTTTLSFPAILRINTQKVLETFVVRLFDVEGRICVCRFSFSNDAFKFIRSSLSSFMLCLHSPCTW